MILQYCYYIKIIMLVFGEMGETRLPEKKLLGICPFLKLKISHSNSPSYLPNKVDYCSLFTFGRECKSSL